MHQLKDILRFKKELYFNGAVQVDWFYNEEKQNEIAKSFVFHGPEYFGVAENDIAFKSHRLVDTATFTNILANKLYDESPLSNFFMTIAPYGTGKSHLAVTLASLFSGDTQGRKNVLSNLQSVDLKISKEISTYTLKPNLVLILNGMKDFNLNYEILNTTQKTLDINGVNGDFLKDLTKSYDIARNFVSNTFENYVNLYEKYSEELLNKMPTNMLKEYLVENILQESNVFEVVNKVYFDINGTYIRWDEGVSAGDVLTKIADALCGERAQFNKVVVFFDEFGRYIEFASSYPTRAGDSALQQIYEAVQDSNDKIIFVGFIQSDLKSYLTRVDRTANINRYIGRYEASEKVHLSSNLETIFANLIERKNQSAFKELVVNKIDNQINDWRSYHEDFLAWAPQAESSSVWGDFEHFKKVVLEGIYPLHPLTSWMLSNLSSWLQQRSSLTFLERQIEFEGERELREFGDLVIVPATRIIRTEFFKELLAAEQEGRKQSEYAILYNQVLSKYDDKFDERQREVLAANLILRIGRFKTRNAVDAKKALAYASNLSIKEVEAAIEQLEGNFGVISFDESANVYDFVADAIGINDFKRLVNKKKSKLELDLSLIFDNALDDILPLDKQETAFGGHHFIKTTEWQFTQKIVHIKDMNLRFLTQLKKEWKESVGPDTPKGRLVWIYLPADISEERLNNVKTILKKESFNEAPIAFCILDDKDNKFHEAIQEYQITNLFTPPEKEKYSRFITDFKLKVSNILADSFNELATKRLVLKASGIEKINVRPSKYIEQLFMELYSRVIPFPFTEFAQKNLSKGKKHLSRIGRLVLSEATFQLIHSETTEIRNRVEDLLFEKKAGSWGVFNGDYQMISPTNPRVLYIFNEWDEILEKEGEMDIQNIFDRYQVPPFGINDYALALLIAVYLVQHKSETRLNVDNSRLRLEEWSKVVFLDKNVDFKSLFSTIVLRINPEESASRYLTLFKKVNQNNDVLIANQLFNDYEKLKKEEDVPRDLEDKVAHLEYLLKEGHRLYNNSIRKFGKIRADISEATRKKDDFKLLFEILDTVENIHGQVEDSEKYVYNISQIEEAKQIEVRCHNHIKETFPTYIKELKCQSLAQASGFDKWVDKIIDSLNKHDYLSEARQLKSRKNAILDNLNEGLKTREIEDTINQFARKNAPSVSLGYQRLVQIKEEGSKNIEFVKKSKVDNKIKEELHKIIEGILQKTDDCLKKLNAEVGEIYDAIYDLSTVDECENFFIKVKQILNKEIREEDREGIEEAANNLQNFLNDIQVLHSIKENREALMIEIRALEKKWMNIESEIDFSVVLVNYKNDLVIRLNEQAEKWKVKYIVEENDLNSWDFKQCSTWLQHTNVIPLYLTSELIQDVNKLDQNIQKRLSELNVDAVIGLFFDLTKEQQEVTLQKMKEVVGLN
ncbi:hypothetical protein BBH88_04550 [Planococcus antarcticus DSM 14505]|uniref:AAA+ ATPase domain-containing protein n=1 Tax=Planococcus antarcticus DSM 14505 TaxID=1185653 RepID=A0ABM6D341_9BACL|nr:hypothetical protein [Planococcus antarcticus]ANU09617.1 hypothetical protein BBH88_04550 [Planococcus antarcticus DSM 14505]